MKVDILDDYFDTLRGLPSFAKLDDHDVTVWTDHVEDVGELARRLANTEALVLFRERTAIGADLLDRLLKLKLISQRSVYPPISMSTPVRENGVMLCSNLHADTPSYRRGRNWRDEGPSCPDRGHQRADADDVHDPGKIVGEHAQRHFGSDAPQTHLTSLSAEQRRFQARIEGPIAGNVLLRRAQYRASEAPEEIVRGIVLGKIANQRAVLMRGLRDYREDLAPEQSDRVARATERLALVLRKVSVAELDLEALRGAEGEAANLYFGVFDLLIRSPDKDFRFVSRSRRPPLDPINALLSFLYTLLTHDCRSAAEVVGLDPAVGFLHRDRPGRPSLALDLMEELRPALADRLALSLVNRRQLRATDFEVRDGGAVWLDDNGRKTVLTAWQDRKKQGRRHPFIEETAPLGLVPYLQAQLLARHLRGDLDAYPPWFWK